MSERVTTHRRNVQSAMYFLVWHVGMSIEKADATLSSYKKLIKPLANAGREEYRKCENALCKLIDKIEARNAKRAKLLAAIAKLNRKD